MTVLPGVASYWQKKPRSSFGRKGDLPKVSLGRNRTRIPPSFAELLKLSWDILVTAHVTLLLDLRQLRKWPLRSLGCSHLVAKRTHRNPGQSSQELSAFSDGVLEAGGQWDVGGTEQKNDLLHGVLQSLGFKKWGSIPVRHKTWISSSGVSVPWRQLPFPLHTR